MNKIEVETKYSLGEEVYVLENFKIYQGVVTNMDVTVYDTLTANRVLNINYRIVITDGAYSTYLNRKEEHTFKSTEELLQSITA